MDSSKAKTDQSACALEPHEERGEHYHVSIKLSGAKTWLDVRNHLCTKHEISVNFYDKHDNYYTPFKYISKSDQNVYTSQGQPNLKEIGSPQIKKCINAYRKKIKKRKKELQIMNKTINNKMNKTVKRKSFADYPIWMYQSLWLKII